MTLGSMYEAGKALLRQLAAVLRAAGSDVLESEDRLELRTNGEPTVVSLIDEAIDAPCPTIRVSTMLPEALFQLGDDAIAAVNGLAMLSAIVRLDEKKLAVVSRFSLLEQEDVELFDHLLRVVVFFQWDAANRALRFFVRGGELQFEPVPRGAEPSYWDKTDFDACADSFKQLGPFPSSGATGLSVEVGLRGGPASHLLGEPSSLIMMQATSHPNLGNGLLFALRMPGTWTQEEIPLVCSTLNLRDMGNANIPTFLGAWAPDLARRGGVAFTGFVPNILYAPPLAPAISVWLWHRSNWAMRVIGGEEE